MKCKLLVVLAATLAMTGITHADNIRKTWEFAPPSQHFPRFFSSKPKYDILLNDFFARHWFATPGPGAYSGTPPTCWRDWDALASVWFDTSRLKFINRDANAELRDYLQRVPIDPEGYVYTFPTDSNYRNKMGWNFPDYTKSAGLSKGWDWNKTALGQDGWNMIGGATTATGATGLWNMTLTEPDAHIQIDKLAIDAFQSPFVIITMSVAKPGTAALEWTTDKSPEWSDGNRIELKLGTPNAMADYYLPVYKYSGWKGKITALRIRPLVDVPDDTVDVSIDRVQCAYDTRQPVNNTSFILANWRYYLWTGDNDFLKANIGRIRLAAHYLRTEFGVDENGIATIKYWGHDGTSGLDVKKQRIGYGLGSDQWDILPMGYKSTYLNSYTVAALNAMSDIETSALKAGARENPYGENSASFLKLSKTVAQKANETLWNPKTGRFVGCTDVKGQQHDYGFAYANLEALYYGLGDAEKAKSIYSWLDGTRTVAGDTSTSKDIYRWKFAPRTTTKHNLDWYIWLWNKPQSVPWGAKAQDGGTSAYLSFYDVMDRLTYKSPDDAYTRLKEILDWYSEVWDAGGYQSYYKKDPNLAGLTIATDSTETTLVPLSFLYGFLGINPTQESLLIEPKLPSELSYAGVEGLWYHGVELTISVSPGKISIKCTKNPQNKTFLLAGRRVVGTFERTVDGSFATLKPGD